MPSQDPAKAVKTALAANWAATHASWTATLHVDDDYQPAVGHPVLLVADDSGPAAARAFQGPRLTPRRPVLRLTAFAKGRDEARQMVDAAADYIQANRPAAISRIEDVSTPLLTRDRATGAFLASITMPVIVKPVSA